LGALSIPFPSIAIKRYINFGLDAAMIKTKTLNGLDNHPGALIVEIA
jgi:hypothetical protein